MKTKILLIILFPLICGVAFWASVEDCTPQKFVVSWYYSPKKWQNFYYRWNYEAEVRLNWWGIKWASWKKVFNWMIAAPKNYKFWTYIYFPWYGVWEVSDRWWAIVNAWVRGHSYDRIDVWMWEGEEWLKRALSFGKRELSWYLCKSTDKKVWFDYSKFPILTNFFAKSIWSTSLSTWRTDKRVSTLQTYLNLVWYLWEDSITWTFWNKTKWALCKYQVDNAITTAKDEACGTFGPLTRKFMQQQLTKLKASQLRNIVVEDSQDFDQEKIASSNSKKQEVIVEKTKIIFSKWFNMWDKSWEVSALQKQLIKLWFYKWNISWVYDNKTAESVYSFQLEHKLVWPEDKSAIWYFGPKTRDTLNNIINS